MLSTSSRVPALMSLQCGSGRKVARKLGEPDESGVHSSGTGKDGVHSSGTTECTRKSGQGYSKAIELPETALAGPQGVNEQIDDLPPCTRAPLRP